MNQQIIILNPFEGKTYMFSKKIQHFSYLFACPQDDFQFTLPSSLKATSQPLEIIQKFLQIHNYDPKKITSSEILFVNYKEAMSTETLRFLDECIEPLKNEEIQELLRIIGFFQIQSIERIIYTYLANRYQIPLAEKKTEKKLKFYGVNSVEGEKVEELKLKYAEYFKGVGKRLGERYFPEESFKEDYD